MAAEAIVPSCLVVRPFISVNAPDELPQELVAGNDWLLWRNTGREKEQANSIFVITSNSKHFILSKLYCAPAAAVAYLGRWRCHRRSSGSSEPQQCTCPATDHNLPLSGRTRHCRAGRVIPVILHANAPQLVWRWRNAPYRLSYAPGPLGIHTLLSVAALMHTLINTAAREHLLPSIHSLVRVRSRPQTLASRARCRRRARTTTSGRVRRRRRARRCDRLRTT